MSIKHGKPETGGRRERGVNIQRERENYTEREDGRFTQSLTPARPAQYQMFSLASLPLAHTHKTHMRVLGVALQHMAKQITANVPAMSKVVV